MQERKQSEVSKELNLNLLVKFALFSMVDKNQRVDFSEDDFKQLVDIAKNKYDLNSKDKLGNTPLHYASLNNSAATKILMEAKADSTIKNSKGQTPLLAAIYGCSLESVDCLIENKADVNLIDEDSGRSSLHHAAIAACTDPIKRRVQVDMITLLLKAKANPNHLASDGTPLHLALKTGIHYSIPTLMYSNEINLNIKDEAGDTVAHVAAKRREAYYLTSLMDLGSDPALKNREGLTPYQLFIKQQGNLSGILKRVCRLLEAKADFYKEYNELVPLATAENKLDYLKILLEHKADPNHSEYEGNTAIKWVFGPHSTSKDSQYLKALLDAKASADLSGTTLYKLMMEDNIDSLRLLIEARADVNKAVDDNGIPLMLRAVRSESISQKCFKLLLDSKVDINKVYDRTYRKVPLIMCAAEAVESVASSSWKLSLVLEAKADINFKDSDGETALFHATHIENIKLLLAAKIDPSVKNHKGLTALDCARDQYMSKEALALLVAVTPTWYSRLFGVQSAQQVQPASVVKPQGPSR